MPRKRVASKRSRVSKHTQQQQVMHLLKGWALDRFPFEDEGHRRECWEAWKDELLHNPDYRGWGFFKIAEGSFPHAYRQYVLGEENPTLI